MKQNTYGIIPLYIVIILFCLFLQPVSAQTVPTNPNVSLNISGTTVNISWSADNADTYMLYAAPYPGASVIYDFDMGTQTSIQFDLPYGSAYYVAIRASNSAGLSGWSNIEYFDLSQKTPPTSSCGAYVAPGVWKDFDCYNLAAVGKTTGADPFTPSWELIGGYWQWGRKGPDSSQWYDTNTEHFAHGPAGPGDSEANESSINGWNTSYASNGAWSETQKTANDPCPDGYHVPTIEEWNNVLANNIEEFPGSSWSSSPTNYSSGLKLGESLFLPAAGYRSTNYGALSQRGNHGYYWSSTVTTSSKAWAPDFYSSVIDTDNRTHSYGFSVRCIAE